jgi:hypothetical protein
VLVNRRELGIVERYTIMNPRSGSRDRHVNIVGGLAHSAVATAAFERAHRPVEGKRRAVLSVAFMPT